VTRHCQLTAANSDSDTNSRPLLCHLITNITVSHSKHHNYCCLLPIRDRERILLIISVTTVDKQIQTRNNHHSWPPMITAEQQVSVINYQSRKTRRRHTVQCCGRKEDMSDDVFEDRHRAYQSVINTTSTLALYVLLRCLSLADRDRNIVAAFGWTDGSPSASVHDGTAQ